MRKFRRIALATALLAGGIGAFAASQARADLNQTPFFTSRTASGHLVNGVVGTPVEFGVQGWDADKIPPTLTYTPRTSNTTSSMITHTSVAVDPAIAAYATTEHVSFNVTAPGDYSFRANVSDGIDTASRS